MKKCICIILSFLISVFQITPVLANNSIVSSSANSIQTVPYFNEAEAANIALLFVTKNIDTTQNNWNRSTIIYKVYTLYDFHNNVTGYTFMLQTNQTYSGYITVSSRQDIMPIQEFSFTDMPLFVDNISEEIISLSSRKKLFQNTTRKVIFSGPLEYYLYEAGTYYTPTKQIITPTFTKDSTNVNPEIITHNTALKQLLTEVPTRSDFDGQLSGYVIDDLFTYLEDRYNNYTYYGGSTLVGFVGLNMNDFGSTMDCSLVSITAIANWYKYKGYPNIPLDPQAIYQDVLEVGTTYGYTTTHGTSFTKTDDILEEVFSNWGYTINATNHLGCAYGLLSSQLDAPNSNPILINIGTGYYSNHTVTIFGYAEYDVTIFLAVKDNYSTATRYIDLSTFSIISSTTTIDA